MLVVAMLALSAEANVYYAAPDGTGNGSSWENAADYQTAFASAVSAGDEIRLKAGTYTLTSTINIASHPGLTVKGGYTGDGEAREGRSDFQRESTSTSYFRLFFVTASSVTFDGVGFLNGKFSGSVKGIFGLAVCLQSQANCTAIFTNCLFRNNGAVNSNNYGGGNLSYGGALYTDGGTLTISGCDFDGNYIDYSGSGNHNSYGGALYAKSTAVTISGTRFANNRNRTAHDRYSGGGAIVLASCANALIDSCRFETNSVRRGNYNRDFSNQSVGGTAYFTSCSGLTIRDCTVVGGHVENGDFETVAYRYFGMGQMFYFLNSSAAVVRTVLYNRGYPKKSCFADLIDFRCEDTVAGTLSLTNVLMVAGEQGRCLGCIGKKAVIDAVNCTLTGVKAPDSSRNFSAYSQYTGTATFRNCIFWDNAGGACARVEVEGSAEPTLVNCLTETDPLWGDTTYCHPQSAAGRYDGGWFTGGSWVTTDAATSPAIDAGDAGMPVGAEPQPNGRRVNVGYDAGTAVASKSVLGSEPVVDPAAVRIFAYDATDIRADGATVKADVASTGGGANPSVTVVWDSADRGTSSTGAWANSATLDGTWAPWNLAGYTITGATGERVYYRFVASNGTGDAWSDPVKSFKLGAKPTAVYGDMRRLFRTTAQITAVLTGDGEAETTASLVWWLTDDSTAVTTNAFNDGAVVAVGTPLDWTLSGLSADTSYSYQVVAVNAMGATVLETRSFTTLPADVARTFCAGTIEAGLGDGSSWANATDFQTALANATAGDEIRMLAGDYRIKETITIANNAGFVLRGGYTGAGETRDGRSVLYRNANDVVFRLFEVTASTVTFDGICFKDGSLTSSGALGQAVRLQNSSAATFINCRFLNNGSSGNDSNAESYGGAVYANGGTLTVRDSDFEGNRVYHAASGGNVKGWGGAIYAKSATVAISSTTFTANRTGTAHNRLLGGGALAFSSCPSVTLEGCTFDGNYTSRTLYTPTFNDSAFGGTAYMKSCPSVIVRDCVLRNSYTANASLASADLAYFGCGHAFYLDACTVAVSRTVFYNRGLAAKGYAGLLDARDTALAMTNVLMVAGEQGWCLGTYGSTTVEAVNCTFTGVKQPAAATRPDTAYAQCAGTADFRNCIFWDNAGGAWKKTSGDDPTLEACMTATDPLWGDTTYCHPKSAAGRYDGGWFTGGSWVTTDEETSPAVDRIPGFAALATEPQPNGCRVNAGYDGNTEVASKSALGTNPCFTEGTPAVYAYPDTEMAMNGVVVHGDIAALSSGETEATVWLVWDTADRGTAAKEDWANVVPCGTHEPWDLVSAEVAGFVGRIYYRFVAQDGQATVWSDPVREYVRATAPTVAYDTDAHPFTHITRVSARVHLNLVSDGGADTIVWATIAPTADPSAAVDVPVSGDPIPAGPYVVSLTGLAPGTEYTVTVTAQNSVGDAVTEEKTLTTVSSGANQSICAAPAAAGYGDGTSWANAATLADALAAAVGGNGDTVMMLSGTYQMFGVEVSQLTNLTIRGGYDANGTPYAGESILTPEGIASATTDKRLMIVRASKVTLDGLTFTGGMNVSGEDRYGQALGIRNASDVTVTNCVFRQNGFDSVSGFEWVDFYGGAIAIQGGRLTVVDSDFTGNRLMGGGNNLQPYGGAICARESAVVSVRGCTFDRNCVQMIHARSGGGGALAFMSGVQATVESCLFTTNFGRTSSGIYSYSPQSGYGPYGGSIYASSATLRLKNLSVVGGWAVNGSEKEIGFDRGGTFYFAGSTVAGENIEVRDAGANGLADNCDASKAATGAIAVNGGTVALTNVLFAAAHHGACVAHMGGTLELVNGTVADAKGLYSTSPVCGYLQYTGATSGSATFRNCIFWNNAGGFRALTNDNITLNASYSDIEGLTDAENHVFSADPKFKNAAAGDYTLGKGSPCLGAGDRTGFSADMTDLVGNPRVSGGAIDLGPYQRGLRGLLIFVR